MRILNVQFKLKSFVLLVLGVCPLAYSEYSLNQDMFKVDEVVVTKLERIDFSSNEGASHFQTRLSEAVGEIPDFAGKFVSVRFGCGSNCHAIAIINVDDGRVYFGPTAALDFEYSVDSSLLVVDPINALIEWYGSEEDATNSSNMFKSSYYKWDEISGEFIELPRN